MIIQKFSGEKDVFDPEKLKKSLTEAGASHAQAEKIAGTIRKGLYEGITTREIYKKAHRLLKNREKAKASRYGLKKSILQLGPTGYPFELFVGELMRKEGFEITVGETMQGKCVSHEVDVLAVNNRLVRMMECKFHNRLGYKTDVKVPMYIKSRFEDLSSVWKDDHRFLNRKHEGWVVTNARFTKDAIDFGQCSGLHLLSWDYPGHNLKSLVNRHGIYPITIISSIPKNIREKLFEKHIILANTLVNHREVLLELGMDLKKANTIIDEAKSICEL
ncbi:MAG: ATPase [Flammeovirgaceae bacterium]|nr:ATPase [Flammeovirgaceae bacterium]MBE62030.1 ATPase [Flammeovirgaceae bacterium]HCX23163.1 ATPase [Cytophagales bacterium]|tara:strand:- start:2037 stop:2861 length:825 start_codon:yes stop_codon:yes gene_type:complete